MSDWSTKKCQSCSGFKEKIKLEDAKVYLRHIIGWELMSDNLVIFRRYQFKNFKQTMFFVNALAFICETEGHHPDLLVGYNYCEVRFTTHELKGLSENDFICASKINDLLPTVVVS